MNKNLNCTYERMIIAFITNNHRLAFLYIKVFLHRNKNAPLLHKMHIKMAMNIS